MYKWIIDVTLKSGEKINGLCCCDCINSNDVAKLLLNKKDSNTFINISDITNTDNIFIRYGEIAAINISFLEIS